MIPRFNASADNNGFFQLNRQAEAQTTNDLHSWLTLNSTITTRLAYCLAFADALAQRLLPAVQLSFEYLTFLINRAKTQSEMETDNSSVPTLALVEDVPAVVTLVEEPVSDISPVSTLALVADVSAVATPVKEPATDITPVPNLTLVQDMPAVAHLVKTTTPKRTRKMAKPMGFTTTAASTKRRGKRSTLPETA